MFLFVFIFTFSHSSLSGSASITRVRGSFLPAYDFSLDTYFLGKIPEPYRQLCLSISAKTKIPLKVIYRLVENESNWDEKAYNKNKNGTFDVGLAQINSNNFEYFYWKILKFEPYKRINYTEYFYSPVNNLWAGFLYLRWLLDYYDNDYEKAIMAYNCGLGNVNKGNIPRTTVKYAQKILEKSL